MLCVGKRYVELFLSSPASTAQYATNAGAVVQVSILFYVLNDIICGLVDNQLLIFPTFFFLLRCVRILMEV